MKTSVETIKFEGAQSVLESIEKSNKSSVIVKLKNILDYEIEIQVSHLLIASVLCLGFITAKVSTIEEKEQYPIVVIHEGGNYEVY